MSLDDVARVTKIQPRILERLEAGKHDGLPAEVFVRGFVRSFARCVGLDEGEALRRYAACGLGAGTSDLTPTARALVEAMAELVPTSANAARATPRKMLAVEVIDLATGTLPPGTTAGTLSPAAPLPAGALAPAAPSTLPAGTLPPSTLPVPAVLAVGTLPAVATATMPASLLGALTAVAAANAPTAATPAPGVDVTTASSVDDAYGASDTLSPGAAIAARDASTTADTAPASAPVPAALPVAAPACTAPEVVAAPVLVDAALDAAPARPVLDGRGPSTGSSIEAGAARSERESKKKRGRRAKNRNKRGAGDPQPAERIATGTPSAPSPVVTAAAPAAGVPWRRLATASSTAVVPSLVIDDSDPESAERVLEARAGRQAPRRSFLPPILLDREDRWARQGALMFAVLLLLVAATLTLSYLMRRPG